MPNATDAPVSKDWTGDHAILLVHGVGNASPGDYDPLVRRVLELLGATAPRTTIYELYYDVYNDWIASKLDVREKLADLFEWLKWKGGDDDLADSVAEFAGDVLWPILSVAARELVRTAYLVQLEQIVRDGIRADLDGPEQHLTIICHSLGCFHTYEVLHAIATSPEHGLTPGSDGVRFDNVIFMASPVNLIRTASLELMEHIGPVIPNPERLATVDAEGLFVPGASGARGRWISSVRNWISIAGNMDPVGGHFFGRKAPWAYMEMSDQRSIVDAQQIVSKQDLIAALLQSLRHDGPPRIPLENPHSWDAYVARHANDLAQWITA